MESVKEAALRFVNLLLHPEEEWNVIASEKPSLTDALFPFTAMGFILLVLAQAAGYFLRSFRTSFVLELLMTVAVAVVPLALFSAAAAFLAGRMQAIRRDLAVTACLYSFSPAWLLSILFVIPVVSFGWLWIVLALVFVSILFVKASSAVLGVPEMKKLAFAVLSLASLAVPMILGFLLKHLWLLSKEIL